MDSSVSANSHAVREYLSLLKLGLITIAKVILAGALSVGAVILGLTFSLHFEEIAGLRSPLPARDSATIVVVADVKNWEPIFPDGPMDATDPERQINVVNDTIVIGHDRWFVRFKVAKVETGVFDAGEVHMLIHSPSEFGVRDPGQRFVLGLSRRSQQAEVIASSHERLSQGLSYFTFAEPLYNLVWARPRPR